MSLADEGEGRIVTIYFRVKLEPRKRTPIGETEGAQKIADALQTAGSAALKTVFEEQQQDYVGTISSTCFIN